MKAIHFYALVLLARNVAASFNVGQFSNGSVNIPSYVVDYAPLVYLDVNEYYLPSDIGTQLVHTVPDLEFHKLNDTPAKLTLNNLSKLNVDGNCTFHHFDGCPIYLTSKRNESHYPPFFNGTLPNPKTGETEGAKSAAIIVNDHGNGTVDAYYMYFYAFNLGDYLFQTYLGNHVGDWEHTMLRFINGTPSTMWFSQHTSGEVYTYSAVSKHKGRPIVYSALGTHANYAVPGKHTRQIVVTVTDHSSAGPLWDPVRSAYFFTFTPLEPSHLFKNGTFQGAPSSGNSCNRKEISPIDWLTYYGRWGNKQLRNKNPAQFHIGTVAYRWEDGPTGPYDKDLNRNGTCPDGDAPCTTTTVLPSVSGNPTPSMTITRSTMTTTHTHCHSHTSTAKPSGKSQGTILESKVSPASIVVLLALSAFLTFV